MDREFLCSVQMTGELKNFVLKLSRLWQMDRWTSSSIWDINVVLQWSTLPVFNSAALHFVINEPLQWKGLLKTAWAAQPQAQVAPLFNCFTTWTLMNNTSRNLTKLLSWDLETSPCDWIVQKHTKLEGSLHLTSSHHGTVPIRAQQREETAGQHVEHVATWTLPAQRSQPSGSIICHWLQHCPSSTCDTGTPRRDSVSPNCS